MSDAARIVKEYAAAKDRHDVEASVAFFHPDGYYETAGSGPLVRGHAALREFYRRLFESLPDYTGSFGVELAGDDVVIVSGTFGGTTTGEFMGTAVTPGRRVEVPVVFVCTVRDGLLASDVGYYDSGTLWSQVTGEGGLSAEQASRFVGEWSRLWTAPSYEACRPLLHDEVVGRWPGFERPLRGADAYAGQVARVAELVPDIRLWPTAHATEGDLLFISWEGAGTVGGRTLDLYGIDRFRLREGRVAESVIAFDLARIASAGSAPVGERAHQPA